MARAARPPSSGGGRPSKRTPEIKARVIAGLKAGLTLKLACERVSITTVTLHSWEIRGRKEQERRAAGRPAARRETRFLQFLQEATRARASANQHDGGAPPRPARCRAPRWVRGTWSTPSRGRGCAEGVRSKPRSRTTGVARGSGRGCLDVRLMTYEIALAWRL